MPIPTEAGSYWWQERAAEPAIIVKVEEWVTGLGFKVWRDSPRTCGYWESLLVADSEPAQWGARIPESPTIKAMREMAAEDPRTANSDVFDEYPDAVECLYCQAPQDYEGHIEHALDCSWLRSQEKPDANAD